MRVIFCKTSLTTLSRSLQPWRPGPLQYQCCRGVVYTSQHEAWRPQGCPTVTHLMEERTRPYGDKLALVDVNTGKNVTYREFFRQAFGFARGLRERGFREGDRYMVISPNTVESAVAILGVMAAGGVFTGVNPAFTREEIQRAMDLVKPAFIHAPPALLTAMGDIRQMSPHIKEVVTAGGSTDDSLSFHEVVSEDTSPIMPSDDFDPKRQAAAVLFSSGTTGFPKGAELSAANFMAAVCSMTAPICWDLTTEDFVNTLFPFFHTGGLTVALLCNLWSGCSIGITSTAFNFEEYLKSIEKYKATTILIPPTVGRLILASPLTDKYDISSVKRVLTGAAPVKENLLNQLSEKLNGAKVDVGYGMTEVTCLTHNTISPGCAAGSVGKIVPGLECKIIDLEDGHELSHGEEGEVLIRGDVTMLGYLDNPEATAEGLDDDGWWKSGDTGYCDQDGNLFIIDRRKELIKAKGFQVAPAELEDLLIRHPAVADAGVIGVPHEDDELVRAYIVRRAGSDVTAEDLSAYVAKNTVYYKHLRGGVRFLDDIPKLPTGKILRRVLRDMAKDDPPK